MRVVVVVVRGQCQWLTARSVRRPRPVSGVDAALDSCRPGGFDSAAAEVKMNKATERVRDSDLAWWLELAPRLDWIFAKTYAQSAPHSYVVQGRTPGLSNANCIRAGAVIRTFGQPGKFHDFTNIYLTSADGSIKWWTMDASVANTDLINQATTDRVYGAQNALRTRSVHWSVYDEIATEYDRLFSPVDGDEKTGLIKMLGGNGGDAPMTLDIGCGTGAVLDLGITTANRYVGVDPSQAMLNELVLKHSGGQLAAVIPQRAEDAIAGLRGEKFDLVIAAFGSASYLEAGVINELPSLCSGTLLLMTYGEGYVPGFYEAAPLRTASQARAAVGSLAAKVGGRVTRLGKFDVIGPMMTA